MRIRFGRFRLDTERKELRRGAEAVPLPPKAFHLLEILAAARPNPVSRQDLQDTLWPETFVDEGSLHNLIYQLRQALDDERQQTIRTVRGFGFSFLAAGDAEAMGRCLLVIGGEDFPLHEGENVIGRELEAAVRIEAPSISRQHARITVDGSHATIEDLDSKNGTTVGGRRLHEPRELTDGDQILFGSVAAKFRLLPLPRSTETVRNPR